MIRLLVVIAFIAGFVSSSANAQLVNENLLAGLPDGYKVGFQKKSGGMAITELVPKEETVENWTEMVTVQIFFGNKNPPAQFKANMEKLWSGSCANSTSQPVTAGTENGYPFSLWLLTCPLNKQTGKPEFTWMKAIGGNDSLYVVQKAFKFQPSKEQIEKWMQFFRKVSVCDSRRKDRACPAVRG